MKLRVQFTLVLLLILAFSGTSRAAITPQQRKELNDVRGSLNKIAGLIGKNQLDEAQKALDEAAARLDEIAAAAKLNRNDKALAAVYRLLDAKRAALHKKAGKP